MSTLVHFERKLSGRGEHQIDPVSASERYAAVAVFLRFLKSDEPEVLLMRRALNPQDPWSGQVSLPGGKRESDDPDLLTTAVRETDEELGFSPHSCGRYLGPLDVIAARAKRRIVSTTVAPFVFVQTRSPKITLNDEVSHVFWFPLHHAASGQLDGVHHYEHNGQNFEFPSWQYNGEIVWGLTYRMLHGLLSDH